jgi:hypothetical protein
MDFFGGTITDECPAGNSAEKSRRWSMVARCPLLDPKCRPARARKNYWRPYARYPEIAKIAVRLGLTPLSVYDSLYRLVAAGAAAQQERVQSILRL